MCLQPNHASFTVAHNKCFNCFFLYERKENLYEQFYGTLILRVNDVSIRLFGGLINDLKRKYGNYWSDIRDGFHIQCVASTFFLFFACITPIVTFGGLMGQATDNYMVERHTCHLSPSVFLLSHVTNCQKSPYPVTHVIAGHNGVDHVGSC